MKKIVAAALLAALAVAWAPASSQAGTRARLRWEGAALALGTLGILTVLNEVAHAQPAPAWVAPPGAWRAYDGPDTRGWAPGAPPCEPDARWTPGYWEETNVWVPGVWGLVWVWDDDGAWRGGRYDRRDGYRGDGRHRDYPGRRDGDGLRRGHYEERRSGGHFERRRVWRDGRDHRDRR